MRRIFRISSSLAAAILLAGLAAPADAASTVTLDVSNVTLAVAANSYDYTFTGTVHLDTGATLASAGVFFPYQAGLVTRLEAAPIFFTIPTGGTYTGDLFTVTVAPTSALGLYNLNLHGAPVTFDVDVINSTGARSTISSTYSVTVVAAPVPEPSAWVSASIAVFTAAGLGGRRLARRRAG